MAGSKQGIKHQQSVSKRNPESRAALEEAIRRETKKANERLQSLERKGYTESSSAYRYVQRKAYDGDQAYKTGKGGLPRFSGKTLGKSYQELQAQKAELERFNNQAKTSTVRGVERAFKGRYKSFVESQKSKHPGEKPMSMDEYGNMWRNAAVQRWKKAFGSGAAIKMHQEAVEAGLSEDEIASLASSADGDYMEAMEDLQELIGWQDGEESDWDDI